MSNQIKFAVVALVSFLSIGIANAQENQRGAYIGLNVGLSDFAEFDSSLSAVTNPTKCDVLLYADPGLAPSGDSECADTTPRALSSNDFSPGLGFTGGLTAGYDLGKMRIELEYRIRSQGEDTLPLLESTTNQALASKTLEWSTVYPPVEHISNYRAHQVFTNLYYDFTNRSRWTPFIGAGVGIAPTKLRYSMRHIRKTLDEGYQDVEPPLTAADRPAAAAGTMSLLDQNVSDTIFGFQLIGGLDYAIGEHTSIGITVHWARLGKIKDDVMWSIVRSHKPVRADGKTPFAGEITLNNFEYLAATVGLKYHF